MDTTLSDVDLWSQMISNAAAVPYRQGSDVDALSQEVSEYLCISANVMAFSAQNAMLKFWKDHAKDLPKLSCLARVYLCIHAGSVPVECLFSTTGIILNNKRSSLSRDKVNMITFIHDNSKYL